MEENKFEVKRNYRKKIISKFKKVRLYLFNKTYHKPISYLTIWEFIKIILFLVILVLIFIKFLLPPAQR